MALLKLPTVSVQSLGEGWQLLILAITSSFLGTGAETVPLWAGMPVPLWTRMKHTSTEPQELATLHETVWGSPTLFPW